MRVWVIGLTLLFTTLSCNAAGIKRDWLNYPAIVTLTHIKTIYAVGDAHGDPERLEAALVAAKVMRPIPNTANQPKQWSDAQWEAKSAVLVVTGDMINKGHNSIGVITLLIALQRKAQEAGGRVVILMGNHEVEFLANPNDKKTADFADELRKAGLNPVEVAACKGSIGQFLCHLPIAAKIDDWFFSHAGNTHGRDFAKVKNDLQQGIDAQGFATPQLRDSNSIVEVRWNKKGPNILPWFMEGKEGADAEKVLDLYANKLGVKHLVQGHQPGNVKFPDGVKRDGYDFFQYKGVLFLIDSGMSRGTEDSDSTGGVLKIEGGKAEVLCSNGAPPDLLWSATTQINDKSRHCGAVR